MLTGLEDLATRTKTRLDMLPLMKLHSLNAHKFMLAMSLQKLLATKTVVLHCLQGDGGPIFTSLRVDEMLRSIHTNFFVMAHCSFPDLMSQNWRTSAKKDANINGLHYILE